LSQGCLARQRQQNTIGGTVQRIQQKKSVEDHSFKDLT